MAFQVLGGWFAEKPKSQSGDVPFFDVQSTREYAAWGYADANALVTAIIAAPGVSGLLLPAINILNGVSYFIEKYSYREGGGGCWDVVCHYRYQANEWTVEIDTTGATAKVMNSQETLDSFSCDSNAPGLPPDFDGAIGVTDQGVDGVDMPIPKQDITVSKKLQMSTLSAIYVQSVTAMVGCTNLDFYTLTYNGQSLTYDSEELMFLGMTARQSSADNLDLNYKFSYSVSTTVAIGDSPDIAKQGWQYLWVKYTRVADSASNLMITKPQYAYLERAAAMADFTILAL